MRTYKRSARNFNVRSDRGHVRCPLPEFTTGFVCETAGAYACISDDAVVAAALGILSRRVSRVDVMNNPRVTREYLTLRLAGLEHEIFACLYLDTRNRLIACEELFRGTIDGASVHPREVVKRALAHNAAAVILAHSVAGLRMSLLCP